MTNDGLRMEFTIMSPDKLWLTVIIRIICQIIRQKPIRKINSTISSKFRLGVGVLDVELLQKKDSFGDSHWVNVKDVQKVIHK